MKKQFGIYVIAAIACMLIGFYFWQNRKPSDSVYFAEYLPSNTLAVMSLTDINGLADNFGDSPLGQLLGKEAMSEIFHELKVHEDVAAEYNRIYDGIAELTGNQAFRTIFGDDTVIALLTPDLAAMGKGAEVELQRNILLFATTAATGALEKLGKLLVSDTVVTEKVDGRALTRITVDGQEFWGFADKGIVLLAFEPSVILRGLALRDSGSTLAGTVSFGDAVGFWQQPEPESVMLRTYLDVAEAQVLMAQSKIGEMEEAAQYLNGIRYVASVATHDSQGLQSEAKVGFTSGRLHEVIQAAITNQVQVNSTLNLLGEKCLVYDWASTLIPEIILFSAGPEAKEDIASVDELLRREVGFSLENLFEAFGPQYGFTINEIVNGGFIPVPKVAAFVEVRDYAMAQKVFEGMRQRIEAFGLAAEQQIVSGEHTLHIWQILPGETTQLAMALTPDMLYLANGMTTLTEMLAGKGKPGRVSPAVRDGLGEDLSGQLESARLGSFVLYPERLAEQGGEIAQWIINTVVATQGISVERLGQEMLKLMKSYQVLVITSTLSDESGQWRVALKKKNPTAE